MHEVEQAKLRGSSSTDAQFLGYTNLHGNVDRRNSL